MPRIIPSLISEIVEEISNYLSSLKSEEDIESDLPDTSPFWLTDNQDVIEEGMLQLANELDTENADNLLDQLPPGYRIVYSIFNWEQSRAGEGFKTGTDNSGATLVNSAADSYQLVGMDEEANALRSMLDQYAKNPLDYEKIEEAYTSDTNPYKEDWDRIPYLVSHLRENADRYFYVDG